MEPGEGAEIYIGNLELGMQQSPIGTFSVMRGLKGLEVWGVSRNSPKSPRHSYGGLLSQRHISNSDYRNPTCLNPDTLDPETKTPKPQNPLAHNL